MQRQLAERLRVAGAMGGIFTADNASIHPAKLVRGLARAVERRGGTIHEGTTVTGFTPGVAADVARGRPASRPVLHTDRGDVRASTVVLAGEAWLTRLKRLHRQLIPAYSLIVLTEPLSDEQWAAIGWADRECVHSFRESIDYLARTPDGRILFGGRGAPYHFGSKIRPEYDVHAATHEMLRGLARAWFPSARRRPLHARLGRAAGHGARLDAVVQPRSGDRRRLRPRLRRARRGHLQSCRADARRISSSRRPRR